jgi:hypothetical protein
LENHIRKLNQKYLIKMALKMNKLIKIIVAFVIIVSVLGGCNEDTIDVTGFGVVTGKVVEAKTFEPVENAKVTLTPTNNSTFTDADGEFIIEGVPAGDYSVQAEKEGFLAKIEAATVADDDTVNIVFEIDIETALNKPPSAPTLISPEDNSTGLDVEVELVWSASIDPDQDELTYGITVRNDFNSDIISVNSLTDTTYVLPSLRNGTKYFWQVAVSDNINDDVLTVVSSFETNTNPENRFLYVQKENGNNVIFSSNESGGNKLQLTNSSQNSWRPRLSTSAKRVAFLSTNNTETHIFTMNPDGTDVKQVTSTVSVGGFNQNEIDFSWSANGDRLIYPNFDKLYMINEDGSGLQLIHQTSNGGRFITECDWSLDESFIALKTNNVSGYAVSIYTINMSGTVTRTILSNVNGAAGGLNLSADGKKLLYTRDVSGFQDVSYRQLDTHMFIYNFNNSQRTDLSVQKEDGTNDLDPRFSPNEASVIFVNTSNDGISQRNIFKQLISNNTRTELFTDSSMPDWE